MQVRNGRIEPLLPGGLALGTIEGPVAGGDAGVIAEHDRAGEDVNGELVDPLVVVAFVELVAVGRVPEKSGSFANLGADGVVESAESSGPKLVPVSSLELVEHGGLLLNWAGDSSDGIASRGRYRAFKAAELASTTRSIVAVAAIEATVAVAAIEATIAVAAIEATIAVATIEATIAVVSSRAIIAIAVVKASIAISIVSAKAIIAIVSSTVSISAVSAIALASSETVVAAISKSSIAPVSSSEGSSCGRSGSWCSPKVSCWPQATRSKLITG